MSCTNLEQLLCSAPCTLIRSSSAIVPQPTPARRNSEQKKTTFTLDDVFMATKNYYLQQKVIEVFLSEASLANLARASLDLGYLYDNIGLADPYARRVLDHFKEIWKLESLIAKKGPQGAA
ncbi:hypothetical protein FA13DRAFT_1799611 [Coprinellus micaceus]|uniref:Uncharacterized protein n=1 Tax=Coprinellus micaceus TaxID=71717 RepID=A0A4Y7SIP5_COPMI|nr:hypothetical protein FA13DRAFT_1799611 [Coprinellus micaceus]